MSLQPTIDAIKRQLSQHDAAVAAIQSKHTDQMKMILELTQFYKAEIELRRRLHECTRSEIRWLRAQTAALRQRRFESEIMAGSEAVEVRLSLKQRLVAKLAKRNTGRAVE